MDLAALEGDAGPVPRLPQGATDDRGQARSRLKTYRTGALFLTMAAAIVYGVLWVVTTLTHSGSRATDKVDALLVAAVVLGG